VSGHEQQDSFFSGKRRGTMKARRNGTCILLITTLLFVTGCAFGTRHATLNYPPRESAGDVGIAEASTPAAGSGNAVVVVPFVDHREDKEIIGHVRNGLGMKTAKVVADGDVARWVNQAVSMVLERAGYDVIMGQTQSESPAVFVLSGEIVTVYCDAYFTYKGEVSVFASVAKGDREVLKKRYVGKGSAGMNWGGTAESYGQSLSLALADALDGLVKDINSVLSEK
jgi:hypothetical protein